MSEECHGILKAYCAVIDKTMGEVLYDWARQELHQQSLGCKTVAQLMEGHLKQLDARVDKPCWGWRCSLCQHETACRVGKDERLFIIKPKWHSYIKPSHTFIKDFDGSRINCCKPAEVWERSNCKDRNF
jgi:hypothetical protein